MSEIRIQAAPLPSNFSGTPQQLFEAMVERLTILFDGGTSFVISDVEPAGNEGPWLKNGTQWWVWDEDQSKYVPLDISESADPLIFVGSTEPDASEGYRLWVKTSGNTVEGIYGWLGETAGWVKKDSDLQAGSVQTNHIADGAITTDKLAAQSVTAGKIQNDLPLSKLARGAADQVLRMDSNASTPVWATLFKETAEYPFTTSDAQMIEMEHALGAVPKYVRVVLVSKETEGDYDIGDEVEAYGDKDADVYWPSYRITDEKIYLLLRRRPRIRKASGPDSFACDPAKWKFKAYYAG